MHILEIGAAEHDEEGFRGATDPLFRTVPKDSTAFMAWRITENTGELLTRSQHGTFYDDECYLFYSCSLPGHPAGPDAVRREVRAGAAAERHVHVWAGARAGGAAAGVRRARRLLALLAGAALHREAQGHETPRLKSYFRDGIRILSGGAAAATRAFQVVGRCPVLAQLEAADWAALASDGIYLVDAPAAVILWVGRAANCVEKLFGAKIAYRLSRGLDKHQPERRLVVAYDGYEQTLCAGGRRALDGVLPLRARAVRPAAAPAAARVPAPRLYRLAAAATAAALHTSYRLEEVKRAPLEQDDLCTQSVMLVDAGEAGGVWTWCGARAPAAHVRAALGAARAFVRERRYAPATHTARLTDAHEPLEFRALFRAWRHSDPRTLQHQRAAHSGTARVDAQSLAATPWLAAHAQLLDDGSGTARAWRVCAARGAAVPLAPPAPHPAPAFFDRDCYIVLYTYHTPVGDASVVYYWMGGSSPNELRNLGAKEAKDLYLKLGRIPMQARILQGQEPPHFLQILKGRLITYIGSATDYDTSGERLIAPPRSLVRVRGQYAREARGAEVRGAEVRGAEVRGAEVREGGAGSAPGEGNCYVVREGARCWLWCAACTTGDERERAKQMVGGEHTLVMEGKEKEDFWKAIGDKRHLLVASPVKEIVELLPPRLFYVALHSGAHYTFEEIISFSQYDLLPESAMLLDTRSSLYVWRGEYSAHQAKENPFDIADKFIEADPACRDKHLPVMMINQGREPPAFTGFFPHWKPTLWKGHKTFNAIINVLEGKAIIENNNTIMQNGNSDSNFDQYEKYPLSLLRGPLDKMPQTIDPLSKELYLTHDDFVSTFGMPYSDFKHLPSWKQKEMKKTVGVF